MQSEDALRRRIRVQALESSAIHTQMLINTLSSDETFEVLPPNSPEGLVAKVHEWSVDVLVLSADLEENQGRGFELLRELRTSFADLRAVILLDSLRPEAVLDAFRAGAKGVFSRSESIERLHKCIRCVHSGQIWAHSRELAFAMEALASTSTSQRLVPKGLSLLSKREVEIVESLAEGLTNREIADRLKLSPHTVKNYLFRIFDRLGVSNRVELLYLTLDRSTSQSMFSYFLSHFLDEIQRDDLKLSDCKRAGERGAVIAQVALGQFFSTRRTSAADLIQAYKWFSIAAEQISRCNEILSSRMTVQQMSLAKRMTTESLREAEKFPAMSTTEFDDRRRDVPADRLVG
jgi:two-component system, NarL family, nitrate/nitrite response regulator NarL